MTFYATRKKKKSSLKSGSEEYFIVFEQVLDFLEGTPQMFTKPAGQAVSLYHCNIPVSLHGAPNLYWTQEIYDNLSILLREYLVDLEQKQVNTKNRNNRLLLGIQDRLCRLDCFGSQAFKRANTP